MKGVLKFWGYGPELESECIGENRLLGPEYPTENFITTFGKVNYSGVAAELMSEFAAQLQDMLGFVRLKEKVPLSVNSVVTFIPFDGVGEFDLISKNNDENFVFHFDVDETIRYIEQENFLNQSAPLYVRLGISPEILPASIRKLILFSFGISRSLSKFSNQRPQFPKAGKDFYVDSWRFLIRAILEQSGFGGGTPLWPENKRATLTINHDIDTEWSLKNKNGVIAFRSIEEKIGLRSAWIAVARLHEIGRETFSELKCAGHEIGCHGTVHDHSIAYMQEEKILERLESARAFIGQFGCTGFRSPSYHHSPTLYKCLDKYFEYDMSVHDSFENANNPFPSYEGCSTCFPFFMDNTDILQIPTTITEDFVLEMQGHDPDEAAKTQIEQIEQVLIRRGVANLLTHPEPKLSARKPWRNAYEKVITEMVNRDELWIALPGEISSWWKARIKKIESNWGLKDQLT